MCIDLGGLWRVIAACFVLLLKYVTSNLVTNKLSLFLNTTHKSIMFCINFISMRIYSNICLIARLPILLCKFSIE